MTRPPRAVSLDLDNTLWDTPPVLERAESCLQDWLERHAPRVVAHHDRGSMARVRAAVAAECPGQAHDLTFVRTEALRRIAAESGYDASVAHAAFDVFFAARNRIDPFADVPAALEWLAARLPVYALTNGNACVHRVGMGVHFAGAFEPAGVGCAKPDPRMFAALVAAAQVEPRSVWHVGDDPLADVEGARRAGLTSVWMNRHGAEWPTSLPPPDLTVCDMTEFVARVGARL